jgi:chitodextrinase
MSYLNAILSFPDVTPPSPPGDLASQTTASSANLSWSPSTDDIGTVGYQVSRADSAQVNTTALTSFFDPNLTDGRTYVYTVRAFDASGNLSASASLSTTTPDRTAPSVPAGLQAAPLIVDSQVNITVSWSPATDNVGVDRYTVLHGLSADSLTQIAVVTDPSFSHLNLQPLVTYYYAVEAVDGTGNKSARSEIISVTTPAVPDVTPPGALILYPAQGAVVRGQFDLAVSTYDPKAHRSDVPSGVAGVRVIVDGMDVAVTATEPDVVRPPFSLFRLRLDASGATVGVHVISVEVRDEAGNTRRSPGVTVIIWR